MKCLFALVCSLTVSSKNVNWYLFFSFGSLCPSQQLCGIGIYRTYKSLFNLCNMYDVYLFNMLFTKFFFVYPYIGDIDGKQVVVNKMFI